ncbi:MAG: hypothetical protein N3J91_06525 [Verrucomicrobiae bacterium]|nr:hypothetical protein [Verrucomicrobiae bacterium]
MNQAQLPITSQPADWLAETRSQARERAARAKTEAEAAARAQAIWEKLASNVEKKWWFHIRAILEQEAAFFHQLRETANNVAPHLEGLYEEAKKQTEELLLQLPRDMERMAANHQLPLDRSQSRHPRYKFRDGFITVEIDELKRLARIKDYEERLAELPPDTEAIAEVLKREDHRLFGRRFDGAEFLACLRKHYLAILKKNKQADGDPVPLRHIARRMADKKRHFRRDEFLIDLSRLVVEGPAEVDGMRFDLQQTKDTEQGMLLYGPAGRGMVNLLIFRKEK